MTKEELIKFYQKNIRTKPWVVFDHGTIVILTTPEKDLSKQAIDILSEYGPVYPGTVHGDFQTFTTDEAPGTFVRYEVHPDTLNYVPPEEVSRQEPEQVAGLKGRENRELDSKELKVIHVEDAS